MKNKLSYIRDHYNLFKFIIRWFVLVLPVAVLSGSASALFLWLLDVVTNQRFENEWLLYFLPISGVAIVFLYQKFGKNSEKGNNLLIEEIHVPGGGVPGRMAPSVFITSVATHLFGGSAGREGTAVQMGGSIAAVLGKYLKLNKEDIRILLMSGIAAGFGSIFGTPFAGAIFALEVLTVGKMQYSAIVPCLISSVIGDITCSAWGIHHTQYIVAFSHKSLPLFSLENGMLTLKVILSAALFGLAALLFSTTNHFFQDLYKKYIPTPYLKPIIGGIIIIGLVFLLGTTDYLGLGVTGKDPASVSILNAFKPGGADFFSWFWKLLFTAITLSSGFKGGEVTPLFFIGACLGNTLAILLNAPVDLFAALGFIAVFGGASNTPLACTLMGMELFGSENLILFAIACFVAYFFSGHSSIYMSQRLGVAKTTGNILKEKRTLSSYKEDRRKQK